MLAQQWKVLDEEQKSHFYTEAEHLKNLHQLQHPDYKYVLEVNAIQEILTFNSFFSSIFFSDTAPVPASLI